MKLSYNRIRCISCRVHNTTTTTSNKWKIVCFSFPLSLPLSFALFLLDFITIFLQFQLALEILMWRFFFNSNDGIVCLFIFLLYAFCFVSVFCLLISTWLNEWHLITAHIAIEDLVLFAWAAICVIHETQILDHIWMPFVQIVIIFLHRANVFILCFHLLFSSVVLILPDAMTCYLVNLACKQYNFYLKLNAFMESPSVYLSIKFRKIKQIRFFVFFAIVYIVQSKKAL